MRIAAALGTLATVTLYLIAQMVGAGGLIRLMFGLQLRARRSCWSASAMIGYVLFGGMIATTWVQIVKAVLLLSGALLLALLVLLALRHEPGRAVRRGRASATATACWRRASWSSNPLDAISLGMALMFGTAGLPHILMRFYTVPDARAARTLGVLATGLIGLFYLLTFVLGFGAMVLVGPGRDPRGGPGRQHGRAAARRAAGRDAVPRLHRRGGVRDHPGGGGRAHALRRRGAVARPLGERGARRATPTPGEQLRVARVATLALGVVAVALGITFKGQNVAFMVSLAFAIAASANFPALVLAIFWRRLHHGRRGHQHGRRHRC